MCFLLVLSDENIEKNVRIWICICLLMIWQPFFVATKLLSFWWELGAEQWFKHKETKMEVTQTLVM